MVPAAGTGTRMGDDLPKQYHLLAGRPMIRHALEALCASPQIQRVFVVLAEGDETWERFDWTELGVKLAVLRCGHLPNLEASAEFDRVLSTFARRAHDAPRKMARTRRAHA